MQVSHFPSRRNHHISRTDTLDWDDFVAFFLTPLPNTTPKDDLPLWCAVTFDGDYVEDAAVTHVHALTFDVDEAPIPTVDELRELPFQAVASTSSSATFAAPRWRLAFALSRPVTAREYRRLWSAVADALPFAVGQASKNPSRGWYYPRAGADGSYACLPIDGEPLDVDAILASAPDTTDLPKAGGDVGDIAFAEELPPALLERARVVGKGLAEECPTTGKRHELSLALSGALVSEGMPHEYIPAFVLEACTAAGFGSLEQKVQNALRTVMRARTGEAVAGFGRLRERFPKAAAAVNPNWGAVPRATPPPAPAPAPAPKQVCAPADECPWLGVGVRTLERPVPPTRYVVPHFGIAPGRPTLFAGKHGLGKTVVAQALLLHAAAGLTSCFGLTIAPGRVWHLDFEMSRPPLQERYQRLAYGHGIDFSKLDDDDLRLCSMPGTYLSDPEAEARLVESTQGRTLAMIDNLTAAIVTSKISENDAQVRQYLDLLTRVSLVTGCAFIVLAHPRKPGKDEAEGSHSIRGSSAIVDACGSVLSLTSKDGYLTLKQQKTSLRKEGEDIVLQMIDVDDQPRGVDEPAAGLRVERVALEAARVFGEARAQAADAAGMKQCKEALVQRLGELAAKQQLSGPGVPKNTLVESVIGFNKNVRRAMYDELVLEKVFVELQEGRKVFVKKFL